MGNVKEARVMVKKNETTVERFLRIFKCKDKSTPSFNYGLIMNDDRTAGLLLDPKEWKVYSLGEVKIKNPKPKGDYKVWGSSFKRARINAALTVLKRRKTVEIGLSMGTTNDITSKYFVLLLSSGEDKILIAPAIIGREDESNDEELFLDFPKDLAKLILNVC